MPKVVDHEARRVELAEAVWRVIVRAGVAEVSIRTVAAEAGWSSGALRHYFTTRAELLAFACELVIDRVTARITALEPGESPLATARAALLETIPVDERRKTEASIAFAFLALGLSDPALAAVQRAHFAGMYGLCHSVAVLLNSRSPEADARRLHALVDGLSIQVLAEHLTPGEAMDELEAYLSDVQGSADTT